MPIYEYMCKDCGYISTFLILKKEDENHIFCKACGKKELKKLISRVSYHKTEAQRLDELDLSKTPSESFYKDTRNIGLFAKKRAKELGVDKILGDKLDEIVERGRTGKILEDKGL